MNVSQPRIVANRANALQSTGPRTLQGKRRVSLNGLQHGLRANHAALASEDPAEYRILLRDLIADHCPVGALECSLVERIAIGIWRQRRLVRAETAMLDLEQLERKIADRVARELGQAVGSIEDSDLEPFDEDRVDWCRSLLAEFECVGEDESLALSDKTPLIREQLEADAAEDDETVEQHLAHHDNGLIGYVAELALWCKDQLQQAEQRPTVLALAEQHRAKAAVLPTQSLDVLSRYQTTLDNQLLKAIRALREAQAWRLETLDAAAVEPEFDSAAAA